MSTQSPHISVVVPSYCCEACLSPLYDALKPALESISPEFEIVIVDDHSPEGDWKVICELAAKDPRVRGVKLTRNFGQHAAISAGLSEANGDWVVVMDCDLQDRPQEIPRLYAKAKEGFQCVFGRRVNRVDETGKLAAGAVFHAVNDRVSGRQTDRAIGNFSIISRRVVLELRKFRESRRNYGMQVNWLGFPTAVIDVEHAARHAGDSSYSLAKKLRHGIAIMLSQSTRPLYVSAAIGLAMALGAVGVAIYLVVRKITIGSDVEGWTSVMVSMFFLFGMLFLNMGVLGLYLGSVFNEIKGRPPFVIERTTYEQLEVGADAGLDDKRRDLGGHDRVADRNRA